MSTQTRVLKLIIERPIAALLEHHDDEARLEASGVAVKEDHFYVVLDNEGRIARLKSDLQVNKSGEVWQGKRKGKGYEALTWSPDTQQFYAVVEAVKAGKKKYHAHVHTFDSSFALVDDSMIDFTFKSANKGIEGLAAVRTSDGIVLLALCEAPGGNPKKKKQRPGLIFVLKFDKNGWNTIHTLDLPHRANFDDFSDIAIDETGRVAVISQENSALWVGQLNLERWAFDGDGELFTCPTDPKGKCVYCNMEGVAWIDSEHVVVVSDRSKAEQHARCRTKEQSIHIFQLPH